MAPATRIAVLLTVLACALLSTGAAQSRPTIRIGLCEANTASQDIAERFRAEATRRGVRILGFEGPNERADLDPIVAPVKARRPDLVFFADRPEEVGPFWRRARELGVQARLLGSDGLDSPAFARLAGPAAVGAYYMAVDGLPPGGLAVAAFRGDFRRRFGREAGLVAAGA
jgi:branched-chain amino acid transport system substrate-binding protein